MDDKILYTKNDTDYYELFVLFVLYLREYLLLIIGNSGLTTFFYYMFICLAAGWALRKPFLRIESFEDTVFFLVTILFLYLISSIAFSHIVLLDSIGVESIGFILFSFLALYLYSNNQARSLLIIKFNTIANILLAFFLLIFSFFGFSYSESGLVYNYLNPNSTGLVALLNIYNLFV